MRPLCLTDNINFSAPRDLPHTTTPSTPLAYSVTGMAKPLHPGLQFFCEEAPMSRKAFLLLFIAAAAAFAAVGTPNVTIKEYEVPTPKSRPHDPARAPDGALWYTGQGANKLGRLDPSTGAFKEYPLETPRSGPHGLVPDSHGNIWFTAIAAGYVGRLDPSTGDVKEYRPAHKTEIDPHTPALDHDGTLGFTNRQTNYAGRLH